MLKTLTYGTGCAPFLAKRALWELANDCLERNPKLYSIMKNDFYTDDLMTGSNSADECITMQVEISNQLEKFGCKLRKWFANNKRILDKLPQGQELNIVKI